MERGISDFTELIKDVPTEQVYVFSEKDAEAIKQLRFLPGNREIKQKKVEQLIEAFEQGVYIPPILVALPFRFTTEGNHRLAAALECIKRHVKFTLRVYFYKDEQSLDTARVINNTQDRWNANDRLNSYVFEHKPAYMALKSFMDEYPSIFKTKGNVYIVQAALCVVAKDRNRVSMQRAFNTGKLVINKDHLDWGKQLMSELTIIAEILHSSSVFARDHSTAWAKARGRLGIPFGKFVIKLRKKAPNWEEPKDSIEAWFNMYLKIAGL